MSVAKYRENLPVSILKSHPLLIPLATPQPNNHTDAPCDTRSVTAPSVGIVAKVNGKLFSVNSSILISKPVDPGAFSGPIYDPRDSI